MRSFLGLANYLNRFSPHLAELSEPLRQICRQNMEFELTESVCVAFSRTKEEIPKNITLPYFNPNSSTTLQTNASKKGLGAVLLQNSKPVMFASRTLTGSERNYQNLERECLATIWGMEKFHYFLYEPVHRIVSNAWWKNDTKTLKFNFFFQILFRTLLRCQNNYYLCIISIKLLTFEEKGNTTKIKFSLVYCCFCTKMQEIM